MNNDDTLTTLLTICKERGAMLTFDERRFACFTHGPFRDARLLRSDLDTADIPYVHMSSIRTLITKQLATTDIEGQ